jgi:hypothetical protein
MRLAPSQEKVGQVSSGVDTLPDTVDPGVLRLPALGVALGGIPIAKPACSCRLPVSGRTLANMLASLYVCFINA